MYVERESGFRLWMKARLSQKYLEQLWDRSTDALKDQLCVPRQNLRVKKRQQQYPTLGRTKVWIQTKVLVFQIDNEVEQEIDPNRNQMEEGNGLEIVATKDVEVGLSRGQPWKRNPVNPINLSGFN